MKFESLPNEIIIECFEYLNMIDIFYSFDMLNFRFYHLIRNIPLHLHVEDIDETTLIQFCFKMQSNSEMKKQILSLTIPDTYISSNANILLSYISLDEFTQLQSLLFNKLDPDTISKISSMLPLLTNLQYFCLCHSSFARDDILSLLPTSTIQTLWIPKLDSNLVFIHRFTSLVRLTISYCYIKDLCYLFQESPNMQYLNIKIIDYSNSNSFHQERLPNKHVIYLKRLVIDSFKGDFKSCEILLKRTPNLKILIIFADFDKHMIDPTHWEQLITTSLTHLHVFKFKFSFKYPLGNLNILDQFQQFHNDFWHQQHRWYIEATFDRYEALFYTVPYMSNEYELKQSLKRYYNESLNNIKAFTNVTVLKICPGDMKRNNEFYFPNVRSLALKINHDSDRNGTDRLFKTEHISCLKTIVNFYNITHLDFSFHCPFESPSVLLLLLLKEAPYISSLKITMGTLFKLMNNRQLCKYFRKMINKLHITFGSPYAFSSFGEIAKICQIFTNLKELRSNILQADDLQSIVNELSKLPQMKIFYYNTPGSNTGYHWLYDHASQLKSYSFKMKCETIDSDEDDYYCYTSDND